MRTFILALMVCAASVFVAGEAFACGACSKKTKEAVEKAKDVRETTAGEDKEADQSEAKSDASPERKEGCAKCGECKESCKEECKEACKGAGKVYVVSFNDKATRTDIEKAATAIKGLAGIKAVNYCEKSNKLFVTMEKDKAIDEAAVKKAAEGVSATISTIEERKVEAKECKECKGCDKAVAKEDTKS
ncbi:MAG: hypothetical protein HUU29_09015 [Planctomycetaceae bacterium]|nr:hypothetical protein [Planctomycetaceae bacterium]